MNPRAADTIADLNKPHYGLQLLLLLVFLVPALFFLLTQQRTLQKVKPQSRKLLPGLVWLQLIPFLGQIWQFFVIVKLAASVKKELVSRYDDPLFGSDAATIKLGNKQPTLIPGLVYSILMWLCYLLTIYLKITEMNRVRQGALYLTRTAEDTDKDSVIVGSLAFATIAGWIVYWIVLAVWKRRLKKEIGFATA